MPSTDPELRDAKDASAFRYEEAFGRNRGWISEDEQRALREKRVAVGGVGGVGGAHLMTLVRLGVTRFHIADLDVFDLSNFNRQLGANVDTLGRSKVEVMTEMARAVNPEVEIVGFDAGVDAHNTEAFLDGVDLYMDGLDVFALEARRAVFAQCARAAVPAITVAPVGMSAALMVFLPGRMSFEDYFGLEGHPRRAQLIRFLVGLCPAALQRGYFLDPSALDLEAGRAPSTAMAIHLATGIAGSNALKILLGRGPVLAAPWGMQFDAYRNRMRKTWRPGGHRNPIQRFTLFMATREIEASQRR